MNDKSIAGGAILRPDPLRARPMSRTPRVLRWNVSQSALAAAEHSTESRIAAIGSTTMPLSPADREFLGDVFAELGAERYAAAIARHRLARRNDAIRHAADRLPEPGASRNAKAEVIAARYAAYLTTLWPRECGLASPPADASESARLMWEIACLNEGRSLGARMIVSILG